MSRIAVCLMWAAVMATAQDNAPHAGYVYPAGGRQGSTFEVVVGGQFLTGTANAYISGADVHATVLRLDKPLTPMQANMLREQLKTLTDKRTAASKPGTPAFTPEDERTAAEIRAKLAESVKKNTNPSIAERVTLQVTVAPNAAVGARELRLSAPTGITNPLVFVVGQVAEVVKRVGEMSIALPAVLNGQMAQGGVDRYRFDGRKGQQIVVAASARGLIPYISDAVPGWFQAAVTLRDAKGAEVAYADHFRFEQDPVLHYEVPADGKYVLEVRDSIYRGREDFVYRVTIGELPFLTGVFPMGGKAGGKVPVELTGWNLPVSKITEKTADKWARRESIAIAGDGMASNSLPFAWDVLPEMTEKEPNDTVQKAQQVKLPVIVNGRINRPGDQDVFRFKGRAGEEIVAEVMARRLESPLDSILKLFDAKGREVASNDDVEDLGFGLITHQADSRILYKLPAGGMYYLQLGDTQHKGGAEYAYRLRVSHPQPDYELRVAPSSVDAHGGAATPITVYALRHDGFAGDIALSLKDAPAGFALDGAVIPGGQDRVRLTLTTPSAVAEKPYRVTLEGRAMVAGREAARTAVPVEDMMQAFAYHHLVASKEMLVQVTAPRQPTAQWKAAGGVPVRIPGGGSATVQIAIAQRRTANEVKFAVAEGIEGITVEKVTPGRDGVAVLLRAGGVKAGLRGNLILNAYVERAGAAGRVRQQALGTVPAIPFEVVGGGSR